MEEGGVAGSIPTPCKVKPGILVERGRGRAHYLPRLEGYDSSKGRVTCRFLSYKKIWEVLSRTAEVLMTGWVYRSLNNSFFYITSAQLLWLTV